MKSSTESLETIDADALDTTTGGMQWQNFCASYNVEDRRPGAGTRAQQRAQTDQWNRERGCPVWSDLHPPTPKRPR
ncbi:hypothetical protein BH11MYX2_BH11MYX2_17480 [soil metagenome]